MMPVLAGSEPARRRSPMATLIRNPFGLAGLVFLLAALIACVGTLPLTMSARPESTPDSEPTPSSPVEARASRPPPRYNAGDPAAGRLPPLWVPPDAVHDERLRTLVPDETVRRIAAEYGIDPEDVRDAREGPAADELRAAYPRWLLGTDKLGRSLLVRSLAGGGVSLTIGLAAAVISVAIGTGYGVVSGFAGGRIDAVMMRIVDVLYGLPYVLLVVLLAVAGDALLDQYISRSRDRAAFVETRLAETIVAPTSQADGQANEQADDRAEQQAELIDAFRLEAQERYPARKVSESQRLGYELVVLLVAIGGVSWLTMARVIRGQVLSLKSRLFMEAARATGVPLWGQFARHLLPNLIGPIVVYTTLTVPQAILQESFLSFLGIGVRPPLPSWGNLAAEGLSELNTHRSDWWQLLFPCLLLGLTLLALNFVGESLRESLDPKRRTR